MSNLSDIGFPTPDETAINEMIIHVLEVAKPAQVPRGFYLIYSDPSGAEMYLQGNLDQELVGFNPHFAGPDAIDLTLISAIERDSSDFDGGFVARFGDTEFVFDSPEFRMAEPENTPRETAVRLTAFASNDLGVVETAEPEFTAVPSPEPEIPSRPIAVIKAEIVRVDRRTNVLSGQDFYSFEVISPIGNLAVVSDPKWITNEPKPGDWVTGTFWLSGKAVDGRR